MQTSILVSIIANIVLGIALLSLIVGPRIYKYITEHKKRRETQAYEERQREIRKIVVEFLEEIKKDG